jgi:glycosyltransferase involved in cell wall biosynthesis
VVKDGDTGFLVPTRRPEDYLERVLLVLEDDPLREALSRRACEVARGHASVAAVSRRWDTLFDGLSSAAGELSDTRGAD